MKSLIHITEEKLYDLNNQKFNVLIAFSDLVEDELFQEGNHYTIQEFERYIQIKQPQFVRIRFETQEELEYIIDQISPFVISIDIIAKHNKSFDFTPFEKCSQLESIQLYWNTKQETLWNVQKNTKLKYFQLMDYYKISDFSMFQGSSIEDLRLFGCNGCGSFVSKMHIADLSFILNMPNLRKLNIDIIKDQSSEYYLQLFTKCQNLEELFITNNFFTFQQFAWLKSKMPNVKKGINGVFDGNTFYSVIGKRTPKYFVDEKKAIKYQKRFDSLVEKYKNCEIPPSDDDKD